MSADQSLNNEQEKLTRALDPNVLQRHASNPQESVWVGASAGSGKTKVLTDRMLRLLLPSNDGAPGTPAHKILALTFTKAAASEMALRISKRLSQWATLPFEGKGGLEENLKSLLGVAPTNEQAEFARRLFAEVIDAPGGIKIMTIHSFCQSVLGRFPLEADLSPNFQALEEKEAKNILLSAITNVIKQSREEKGSPLDEAFDNLARLNNKDQLIELLQTFVSEQRQVKLILKKYFDVNGLYTNLCHHLNIPAGITLDEILIDFCSNENYDEQNLRTCCANLAESSSKTDQTNSIEIQQWLDQTLENRIKYYPSYRSVFTTQKGDIKARLVTKKIASKHPKTQGTLTREAERIIALKNTENALKTAIITRDLFTFGISVLKEYNQLKSQINALDFDDLILKTLYLLKGQTNTLNGLETAPWIRYKMDQGIDHILVDESQDTNPEQWEIISALCDDFFDGASIQNDHNKERTIFVVGDEKQSIFSFQRASPEKFNQMQNWFDDKIKNTSKNLDIINFTTSFRSAPAILKIVDHVFSSPEMQSGLSKDKIKHHSFRNTQASLVELWPVFETAEKKEYDPWTPPTQIIDSASGAAQMANHIGDTIQHWIQTKENLESYDRPIEAGDIMILVRSRTAFIDQLVRALKTRNIPVSGVDRMILNDQLVVQDLCALAQFGLLPDDDLTLATILKSPFIGWNEEKLYKHANKRQSSLWNEIKKNKEESEVVKWLNHLIQNTGKLSPYAFFSNILHSKCPKDEISGVRAIKKRLGEECLDPLDEFLNNALNYEQKNTPNLQNFLQSQLYDDSQIKRQMEEGHKAVRIMTVHGAKGLQAPIVILPDTMRTSRSNKPDRILWPEKTNQALPFYCPTSDNLPQSCEDAKTLLQTRDDEEYKRLLYVALTRAENRLYIGGYKGTKKAIDDSWYFYVQNAFKTLEDVQTKQSDGEDIYYYHHPETNTPDKKQTSNDHTEQSFDTPEWLFKPMPEETFPPKPLMPSRPSQSDAPALSPLKTINNDRFKRGNITHKLLQILPDIDEASREKNAFSYVSQPAHDLSTKIQNEIVRETLDILNHPKFSSIFGDGSVAEAAVTGLLNNKVMVSGQIDRLLINDNEVLIVDYKSNRPSPDNVDSVPEIYHHQMKTYAALMKEIYPNHKIKCALIWTDTCRLMEIPI